MELQKEEIDIINSHVGNMSTEALSNLFRNIDYYINENVSVFIPLYNYCHYAVMPNHSHNSYSFIIYVDNSEDSLFKVEGKEVVIPKMKGYTCVAFSPNVEHQEIIEEGFASYYAVFVSVNYFERIYKNYTSENPLFRGGVFSIDAQLLNLLKQYMYEIKHNMPMKRDVLGLLSESLVHMLVRSMVCVDCDEVPVYNRDDINRAVLFIYKNISKKIVVEDLAWQANLSLPQFNRVFKQVTQRTPNEYVKYVRLERAKVLLKEGKLDLTEVALECGFSSSSYFSHCFIEGEGITPKMYRERYLC